MTIRSFKCKETQEFFLGGKLTQKCKWKNLCKIAKRKLDMLHFAKEIKDLRSPPNNRLEVLKGKLKSYYSIRINDQWRIIFKWDHQPFDVKIVDYH